MQEEVTRGAVTLIVDGAKLSEQVFEKAVKKFLEEIQKNQKPKIYRGRQSLKQLASQNAGLANIEISDKNIKAFSRVAKKYHVDFALKKDTAAEQPRYLVFFKSRDADAITAAFQEFASRKMSREEKPSIRERLTQAKEQAAKKAEHRTIDREKVKVKEMNMKKLFLLNLPYLLFVYPFDKLAQAFRLAPGADLSGKLLSIGDGFTAAFSSPWLSFHPTDLLIGIAGAVILRMAVYLKGKNAKKYRHGIEYGSARWGNEKDIKPFVDPKFENNMLLTATERLTMNTRPTNPANARNLNFCGIGSSGSGKTRFWLTPQLLQAHSSYVVVDPKGGVLGQVGAFLQRRGYQIKVFNSIDFSKSMHYNPLSYIRNEADILKFVNALITNTKGEGKEGDPFWTKAETLLYCALIAYIIFEGPAEDRNMNTLVDMISGMEVKEDDENYKNAVDYMFDGLAKRKPDCFAVKQYRKFKLSSGKTAKSILISCGARLAPFDIPQLREIMSYDELELDRMGDRRTATFFCISDTDSTYNFLVALAFSQMFNLLCERADNVHGGRLPHHVRVLWDEAANTGQVPQLEKLVAVIRSREISLCLLYQQLAQCKAIYDKNAETILGNMDSVLFLGGRESSTIKEISENWLGKATISMQTEGRSRGQSESYSQNTQRLGGELMTPSELATMPGDRCILQLRGLPPFYSKKYDLKQHPNYKYTAEADKVKNAFDLNSLVTRRMDKLNPNETYTVYKVDVPDEALTGEDEDILNYDDLDDPDAFV